MPADSSHSEQSQRAAAAAAIELAVRRYGESGDWTPHFNEVFSQLRAALDPEGLGERLKQEQERLRQILDHAPIGVWHLGPDHRILFVNRTYCDLVGIPAERFLKATHYREVHDEATARRCMESDAVALAAPGIHISRERVRSSDGTLHDLEITKERIEDEKGRVVGLIGLSLDVTERLKAESREAAIARMAMQLTTATTELQVAEVASNAALDIWGWDACFLLGYDRGHETVSTLVRVDTMDGERVPLSNQNERCIVTPLLRSVLEGEAQLILREDPHQETLTTLRFGDVRRASMSLMYVPIRHEGSAIGCLSVQSYEKHRYTKVDLASLQALADHCGGALMRVRAEAQLETERLRFRHLFQNSPIATWFEDFTLVGEWMEGLRRSGVTDLGAHLRAHPTEVAHALGLIRILDVNQAAVAQNGARDKAELIANLPSLFSEQTYADSMVEFEALWQGKASFEYESRSRRLDGEELHLIVRFEIPLKEGVRDLSQVVVTGTNITQHRKAEQARAQAESQLRQSQKMEAVGQLAGGIAHDFNNILTAMMIQLDLLSEEAGLRPEAAEGVEELRKHAARASGLTRQLLTFSRRQVPSKETLALDEVVADAVRMLGRTLGEHITVQFISQPGLPAIEADRGMLGQLLLNLALNARDAMPRGGTLTLQTEVRPRGNNEDGGSPPAAQSREVMLSVRDTGCGMGPETLTHLFEPFFTTKDVGKGTGLGLAMVYGIVQQHDARIEVESHVGQGTTFRVLFPAASLPCKSPEAAPPQPPPSHAVARGTLLVVEDESSVRRMIRVALTRGGYTILEAEDGAKALEIWKQRCNEIDLLLTDLVMPGGIGGLQLARTLRAERPGLKVIFTSGHSRDVVEGADQLPPNDEYLPKPYRIDRLSETVRRVLRKDIEGPAPGPTQ